MIVIFALVYLLEILPVSHTFNELLAKTHVQLQLAFEPLNKTPMTEMMLTHCPKHPYNCKPAPKYPYNCRPAFRNTLILQTHWPMMFNDFWIDWGTFVSCVDIIIVMCMFLDLIFCFVNKDLKFGVCMFTTF